jgi:hypothetical protein
MPKVKNKKGTKDTFEEEKKELVEKKKRVRKTKKELKQLSEGKKEKAEGIRTLYIVETAIVVAIAFVMILLLFNKTFFREEYVGKQGDTTYKIEIPLLYYFVSDEDGVITFKTLRKSDYDKQYFAEYLDDLDKYDCNGKTFYFDKRFDLVIDKIDVEKKFVMKTIKIHYSIQNENDLCK